MVYPCFYTDSINQYILHRIRDLWAWYKILWRNTGVVWYLRPWEVGAEDATHRHGAQAGTGDLLAITSHQWSVKEMQPWSWGRIGLGETEQRMNMSSYIITTIYNKLETTWTYKPMKKDQVVKNMLAKVRITQVDHRLRKRRPSMSKVHTSWQST